jgi:hypothetical protein
LHGGPGWLSLAMQLDTCRGRCPKKVLPSGDTTYCFYTHEAEQVCCPRRSTFLDDHGSLAPPVRNFTRRGNLGVYKAINGLIFLFSQPSCPERHNGIDFRTLCFYMDLEFIVNFCGSPGIPVVTRQISLPRRAKPLEIFGRPLNDVLFSREFRESQNMPKPLTGAACERRSASHVTAARRNTLPRPSSRRSMTWGFLKTS